MGGRAAGKSDPATEPATLAAIVSLTLLPNQDRLVSAVEAVSEMDLTAVVTAGASMAWDVCRRMLTKAPSVALRRLVFLSNASSYRGKDDEWNNWKIKNVYFMSNCLSHLFPHLISGLTCPLAQSPNSGA